MPPAARNRRYYFENGLTGKVTEMPDFDFVTVENEAISHGLATKAKVGTRFAGHNGWAYQGRRIVAKVWVEETDA